MTERFWTWFAWKLPKRLAYWCTIRVCSAATLPPYGDQVVPELTAMDALKRWEEA